MLVGESPARARLKTPPRIFRPPAPVEMRKVGYYLYENALLVGKHTARRFVFVLLNAEVN